MKKEQHNEETKMKALGESMTVRLAMENLMMSDEDIAKGLPLSTLFESMTCEEIREVARRVVCAWLIGISVDSRDWTHEDFRRINKFLNNIE
jgi:hypothetical protein